MNNIALVAEYCRIIGVKLIGLDLKGNRNTKCLAYTSLVCPNLEYRAACWDPCRGQINALDPVPQKAAQFTNQTKDSDWETLVQGRTISRLCALLKAYCGERLGKLYVTG